MIATPEDVCEQLEVDVCLARLQLIAARRRLRQQNSQENRAAVAECRARLDVVLDLLFELRAGRLRAGGPNGSQHLGPATLR